MKWIHYILLILITLSSSTSCLDPKKNQSKYYKDIKLYELQAWINTSIIPNKQKLVKNAYYGTLKDFIQEKLKDNTDQEKKRLILLLKPLTEQKQISTFKKVLAQEKARIISSLKSSANDKARLSTLEPKPIHMLIAITELFDGLPPSLLNTNINKAQAYDSLIIAFTSELIRHIQASMH